MKRISTQLISSSKITTLLTSISGTQITTYSSISKSPINMLTGVFCKKPTSNLSNGYAAAMNNWVRLFSMGVRVGVGLQPSHTRSFAKQSDSGMWSCGDTSRIVEKFKSAVSCDTYFVLPKVELRNCRQTIHVDGRFFRGDTFQIGMLSRSDEGEVLWARIIKGNIKLLMPSPLAMGSVDVNMAEMAGLGYLRIRLYEMGITNFRVVTDSMLSRDYLNRKDNDIPNKSHRFLAVVVKKLWFYSPIKARVIWVNGFKNKAADSLSRARSLLDSDDQIQRYYKAVEDDVANFKERMKREDKAAGCDVVKGDGFDKRLKECMDMIHD